MHSELSLNYFILDSTHVSNVKLSSTARIADLLNAIKESNPILLGDVNAGELEILQVNCTLEELGSISPEKYDPAILDYGFGMLAPLLDAEAVQDPTLVHLLVFAPRTLRLICAFKSQAEEITARNTFSVTIDSRNNVSQLCQAIKEAKKVMLERVDVNDIVLYKVSIPLDVLHPDKNLDVQLPADSLCPARGLSTIFGTLKRTLSVIVELQNNVQGLLPQKTTRDDKLVEEYEDWGSYTALVKRYNATLLQISEDFPAFRRSHHPYKGRFAHNDTEMQVTVPMELFHPVFAEFLDNFNGEEKIPAEIKRKTNEYMKASSIIFRSEDMRRAELNGMLNEILSVDIQAVQNDSETRSDEIVELPLEAGDAIILVKHGENELGEGDSDTYAPGGFSFSRSWAQAKYKKMRDSTSCTTFILATAGPWVVILGAVFTDAPTVQRLTDYIWVGVDSSFNGPQVARVSRLFYALKTGLDSLKSYYTSLKITTDHPTPSRSRFFPSINSYPQAASGAANQTELVRFEYVRYLGDYSDDYAAFHARTLSAPPKDIVVKFTNRYGKEAHEFLANKGLAPKLLYCGSPWPNQKEPKIFKETPSEVSCLMVVMELVHGHTLAKAVAAAALTKEEKESVRGQLQKALELLHGHGYVYGHLRPQNVMITGTTQTRRKDVKLINFVWAGSEGQVKYPLTSRLFESDSESPGVGWPEGVTRLALIKKEHDVKMLDMMF